MTGAVEVEVGPEPRRADRGRPGPDLLQRVGQRHQRLPRRPRARASPTGSATVADIPDVLGRWDVLAAAGFLYAMEFVADKIPYIDSTWDAISTAIRPDRRAR